MEQDADGLVEKEIWKYKHRRAMFPEEEYQIKESRRLAAEADTLQNGNLLSLMKQEAQLTAELRDPDRKSPKTDLQLRVDQDRLLLLQKEIADHQANLAIQNHAQFFQEEFKNERLQSGDFELGSTLDVLGDANDTQKLEMIATLNINLENDPARITQSPAVTLILPKRKRNLIDNKDSGFLGFMLEEYTFAQEIERRMTEFGSRSVFLPEQKYSNYIQQLKEKHAFKEIL